MKSSVFLLLSLFSWASMAGEASYWLEIKADNKQERSELARQGFDIVSVEEDRVIVLGDQNDYAKALQQGLLLERYSVGLSPFDFPTKDEKFHNYQELTQKLHQTAADYPHVVQLASLGKTLENRDVWVMRVSAKAPNSGLPASILMGGHHAREHVSVEMPLRLLDYLVQEFEKKNPRIVSLLNAYEVFIVPVVNPDGKEYDIASGSYRHWRKNRRPNGGSSFGVDLNRNYGFGWGGGGASTSPNDDTFRGPSAFSEKETSMIKNFVEAHPQITTLLSFHTFSQLVLWPWGHQDGGISNARDRQVFETMGKRMAQWNGYRPMQSSGLYIASGDTCDWAYGEHGIFAFTFELDPSSIFGGGFYPGQGVLDSVFNKNLEPSLYLIESSDNPYKVLPN